MLRVEVCVDRPCGRASVDKDGERLGGVGTRVEDRGGLAGDFGREGGHSREEVGDLVVVSVSEEVDGYERAVELGGVEATEEDSAGCLFYDVMSDCRS